MSIENIHPKSFVGILPADIAADEDIVLMQNARLIWNVMKAIKCEAEWYARNPKVSRNDLVEYLNLSLGTLLAKLESK